jgi:activating signal cointegrator 1
MATDSECRIITLWQPWATLIALGHKKYETRSWATKYRGRLIIHAAKRPVVPNEIAKISYDSIGWLEYSYLKSIDYPLGGIIAACELTDCLPMVDTYSPTCFESSVVIPSVKPLEKAVGDWQEGRFAWELRDVRPCEIIPFKGGQGLRRVDGRQAIALQKLFETKSKI